MTNKQASDITDFIEQAKENSLDSLDFTQMSFIIEEVVGDNRDYSHPLLDELGACLRASYPEQYDELVNEMRDAPRQVMGQLEYGKA
jgi:hypothetical protein